MIVDRSFLGCVIVGVSLLIFFHGGRSQTRKLGQETDVLVLEYDFVFLNYKLLKFFLIRKHMR